MNQPFVGMSSLSRESCISTAPTPPTEAAHAQRLEREIVFRGRAQHLVVGGTGLGADEPVSCRTKQIPPRNRLQVIVGLQRLAGPEIVLVVVLDLPEHSNQHDAMVIAAEDVRANALKTCECVDVYWYDRPSSERGYVIEAVHVGAKRAECRPSFGLDENTGTISHGDRDVSAAADCDDASP